MGDKASWVVERSALVRAMAVAAAVIESRNTIPILSNVLIECVDNVVRLTATNLDQRITMPVAAEGSGKLATTVDAKRLHDVVSGFDEGAQVRLSMDDGRLLVRSGRSRIRLNCLPHADFPQLPEPQAVARVEMVGSEMATLFGRVSSAMSAEETRYYLNGIFAHLEADALVFAATDGTRMTRIIAARNVTAWHDVIIPAKVVRLVERLLKDHDGNVTLEVADNCRLRLQWGDIDLISKAVDGTFPDYNRVIPPVRDEMRFVADAQKLAAAVRRMTAVSDGKTSIVDIDLETDRISISCSSVAFGAGDEECPVDYNGAPASVAVNAKFLRAMLESVGMPDQIDITVDPIAPWRLVTPSLPDFIGVIMPVRR